jgi:hypothetical protein
MFFLQKCSLFPLAITEEVYSLSISHHNVPAPIPGLPQQKSVSAQYRSVITKHRATLNAAETMTHKPVVSCRGRASPVIMYVL